MAHFEIGKLFFFNYQDIELQVRKQYPQCFVLYNQNWASSGNYNNTISLKENEIFMFLGAELKNSDPEFCGLKSVWLLRLLTKEGLCGTIFIQPEDIDRFKRVEQ